MKKATVKNISDFLNRMLRVRRIKDASANGLQVRSRNKGEIARVGFAVDACMTTFEKAKKLDIDLLVVHHGIVWRPQKDSVLAKRRRAFLEKNNMALYAAHLPLDLHGVYGNNIQLARFLGLRRLRKFGKYHGVTLGWAGTLAKATRAASAATTLNKALKTRCLVHRFGNERIRTVGVVSGGGGSMLVDAVREKLDCFMVGEIDLAVYNAAKDHGMNLIVAGHYATETVGVKALMPLVRETFGVKTIFIEDRKQI